MRYDATSPPSLRHGVLSPREPFRDEGPARSAGNPKLKIRNPNRHGETSSSEFGLRSSFGFRYSALGFFPHLTAITHRKNAVYPATIVGIAPARFAGLLRDGRWSILRP
jgi:hypothetical protein